MLTRMLVDLVQNYVRDYFTARQDARYVLVTDDQFTKFSNAQGGYATVTTPRVVRKVSDLRQDTPAAVVICFSLTELMRDLAYHINNLAEYPGHLAVATMPHVHLYQEHAEISAYIWSHVCLLTLQARTTNGVTERICSSVGDFDPGVAGGVVTTGE